MPLENEEKAAEQSANDCSAAFFVYMGYESYLLVTGYTEILQSGIK